MVFMTDQILSSLDPFGTESDKEVERVLISLTRSLIVARVGVGILSTEKWMHGGNLKVKYSCQDNHSNKFDSHCSRNERVLNLLMEDQ